MRRYTETLTLKISETHLKTLSKLRERKIKVGDFIRNAIAEKIEREYESLKVKGKSYCPF